MQPISNPSASRRVPELKRKASDDLVDLMDDMILGNGKGPAREKRARLDSGATNAPAAPAADEADPSTPAVQKKSLKRRASESDSDDQGPSARAAQIDPPKRTRLIPKGQTEKAYAGGDRDFKNPDGSSVHKPLQGPVSVHFGHGTTVIDNGGTVKIDHPDGTTILARPGERPTVIRPYGRPPASIPGGGRLEHLDGGDARVYLQDRVVTHFGSGLTRTDMHPAFAGSSAAMATGQRGYYETDSNGDHRFVESRDNG